MRLDDLPGVMAVAGIVHPGYPEAEAVFAERRLLYPAGCLVLATAEGLEGYAIGHPWRSGGPPKLDRCLGELPADPDLFYLHDIALLPGQRGQGHGAAVVGQLARVAAAAGLPAMALVAVSGSAPFWRQHGFVAVDDPGVRAAMASYGAAAQFMLRRPLPVSTS
jgi:GNAT superfamily N-acetyltransferase